MPEGDSLFRLAAKLRPALVGRAVVELRLPRAEIGAGAHLVGRTITAVESLGKNLLVHFDDGSALHTHLRMTGIWHLYPEGRPWRRAPTWAVAIVRVEGATAVCFRAPTVRLLRPGAARVEPRLAALGPDLLGATFDRDEARARLRARDAQAIGEAILDQRAVAGIGNVYKSELLFVAGLDPFAPVSAVSDAELDALLDEARRLLRLNVRGTPRASRAWPFGQVRTTRAGCEQGKGPVHVYGRAGRPCLVCGATVRMARQGALRRSTYFCPSCQGVPAERAEGVTARGRAG